MVNLNAAHKQANTHGQTVSCYVTYEKNEDAIVCINAVNGVWLGSKLLRASYGTTKYCTYFLKGIECTNPNCLYLHELGSEQDSFTKESMILGKNLFSESVHPKVAYNLEGSNIFPHISTLPEICMPSLIHYDIASHRYPPRYYELPDEIVNDASEEVTKSFGQYKICKNRLGGVITAYLDLDGQQELTGDHSEKSETKDGEEDNNEEVKENEEEEEEEEEVEVVEEEKEKKVEENENDDDDNNNENEAVVKDSIIINTVVNNEDTNNNNDVPSKTNEKPQSILPSM